MSNQEKPAAADDWTWPDTLDAMQAAADHHDLLNENDKVRVLDSRVAPGDNAPVHTHRWPAVLYVIGSSDFVRRDDQGKVLADSRETGALDAGSAAWIPPLTPHSLENVGPEELCVIGVEIKD